MSDSKSRETPEGIRRVWLSPDVLAKFYEDDGVVSVMWITKPCALTGVRLNAEEVEGLRQLLTEGKK